MPKITLSLLDHIDINKVINLGLGIRALFIKLFILLKVLFTIDVEFEVALKIIDLNKIQSGITRDLLESELRCL